MPDQDLYSVRMRASLHDTHLSGAERITDHPNVRNVVNDLLDRSCAKSRQPDHISITIESLRDLNIRSLTALDVLTMTIPEHEPGRAQALKVLVHAGISTQAAEHAIALLSKGPAPDGKNMRGAVIMDAKSGERLEPDQERGIRASRFDWSEQSVNRICDALGKAGLSHTRTREALALATKIAHAPGVVAELCWSDDPDYTAGYIASLRIGYVRFPCLKEPGDPKGGRIIFVDCAARELESLIAYLEKEPVLITDMGSAPREVQSMDGVTVVS